MFEETETTQADRTAYPTTGVRIGITYHASSLGKHRPRISFSPEVAAVLRRGLAYPRVVIEGTFVNGLRIWCHDGEGMAPTVTHSTGAWSFSVPVRRVRGREDNVTTKDVPFQWDRDETGPVLIIPRLPDELLPTPVLDKLPNSQVDMTTIMARAEKRLERELGKETAELQEARKLRAEIDALVTQAPPPARETTQDAPEEESPSIPPAPLSNEATDLKTALTMVNELVERMGEDIVLYIDPQGRVQAKRRVVSFIDL